MGIIKKHILYLYFFFFFLSLEKQFTISFLRILFFIKRHPSFNFVLYRNEGYQEEYSIQKRTSDVRN